MHELILSGSDFLDLSKDILGKGRSIRFRAKGSSMFPFIREGDVLTVEPTEANMLGSGAIVFYRSRSNKVIAHRIIQIKGVGLKKTFSIRGDASRGQAEIVLADRIMGCITHIQRHGISFSLDQRGSNLTLHALACISKVYVILYKVAGRIIHLRCRDGKK